MRQTEALGRLILVQGDSQNTTSMCGALRNSGFSVKFITSFLDVFHLAVDHTPALILFDCAFANTHVVQLLCLLKSDSRTSGIREIIISTCNDESDKVRALDVGADDYLTKPLSPRELVARVRSVLRSNGGHRYMQSGPLLANLDARRVDRKSVV